MRFMRTCLGSALAFLSLVSAVSADDWQPINYQELEMTRELKAPGAAAVYLYRQVDRDDNAARESVYVRIKILTDAGRSYADVHLRYLKSTESIRGIKARTIEPDGRVVNFDGNVYDQPVIEVRHEKLMTKSFTMPDVRVGSIIEYRYQHSQDQNFVYNSRWTLSDELFTKLAKFTLDSNRGLSLSYSWPAGLPEGSSPPENHHGKIEFTARDVPAFVTEDHMPPAGDMQMHVDFIYSSDSHLEVDPNKFWKQVGKTEYREAERFFNQRRVMTKAVAEIVAPGDSDEIKLRKIYARCQQVRNTSFERQKSEQERDRLNEKPARDVADVWQRGYGDADAINWLFVALARAAGLQAEPVLVADRAHHFFNFYLIHRTQLTTTVVVTKLAGADLFLDPGTAFAPFGVLPWPESGVRGLKLDSAGGTWIDTPMPQLTMAHVHRQAELRLNAEGSLEGTLTVTYSGLEAMSRRTEERFEDDTERRHFLEDEIKSEMTGGVEVSLSNAPQWEGSSVDMVAVFTLRVPGYLASVGQRGLLPVSLFGGEERRTFNHALRIHPMYFAFPYQTDDDVNIELPTGWQVSSVPKRHESRSQIANFTMAAEDTGRALHLSRQFSVSFVILDSKFYGAVKGFFEDVRNADGEQILLQPVKTTARN